MITTQIPFRLTDLWSGRVTASAAITWTYDPADPYAVQFILNRHDGTDAIWLLGRDLLHRALTRTEGEGDVRAWSYRSEFHLHFRGADGQADAVGPKSAIAGFLDRTFAAVPAGAEHLHFDHDALINHLLKGSSS